MRVSAIEMTKNTLQLGHLGNADVVPYLEHGAVRPETQLLGPVRTQPGADTAFGSHAHVDDVISRDPGTIDVENVDAAHATRKCVNLVNRNELLTTLE
jgi:hypothetical protein